MKKILLLALLLAATACEDAQEDKKPTPDNVVYWCHYYKDKRTDVCFVGSNPEHLDHDHSHLSVVPCTPHIEELVEAWPKPTT
jgi:hypothetical protein